MQAIKVLNMIKLFGKAIRVNKASQDKDTLDVGANLFIGNLDPDVDEKVRGPSLLDWHSSICTSSCASVECQAEYTARVTHTASTVT